MIQGWCRDHQCHYQEELRGRVERSNQPKREYGMEPDLGFLVDRTKQGVSMAYRRLCGKPTSQKSFYPRENDVGKRYDNDLLIPMAPVKVTATHIFSMEVGAIHKNKRLFPLTRKADMPDSSEKGIWNIRKNVPLMASNSRTESSRALTTLISMRLSD